jgi:hypothetical protein
VTRDNNDSEVGSQPPSGYVQWHEWAAAQHRGGLRQQQRKCCGLWKFPQEVCPHPQTAGEDATP